MKKIFLALSLLLSNLLQAHPGHHGDTGSDGYTIIHFITAGDHFIIPVVVVLSVIGYLVVTRKKMMTGKSNKNQ